MDALTRTPLLWYGIQLCKGLERYLSIVSHLQGKSTVDHYSPDGE